VSRTISDIRKLGTIGLGSGPKSLECHYEKDRSRKREGGEKHLTVFQSQDLKKKN